MAEILVKKKYKIFIHGCQEFICAMIFQGQFVVMIAGTAKKPVESK